MYNACFKITWFRDLMIEFEFSQSEPTFLYPDNISDIQIFASSIFL
jgi:hypothetical protein